jgi:transposase-like protein
MQPISYRRHRFPPEIIRHALWLYLRFTLSHRDVEELLAGRGLDVSAECDTDHANVIGMSAKSRPHRFPRPVSAP